MSYNSIPIIVALWQHSNFKGKRLLLTHNVPNLKEFDFNDITSAIGIHPSSNFNPNSSYIVAFYEHSNYKGKRILLKPGAYASLGVYNFNDKISSVEFNPSVKPGEKILTPSGPAPKISPIPVVGELYQHKNYKGKKFVVLENILNLHSYGGFGDITSSVKVFKGPDYKKYSRLILYQHANYGGKCIDLTPGQYPHIGKAPYNFNDKTSAVKIFLPLSNKRVIILENSIKSQLKNYLKQLIKNGELKDLSIKGDLKVELNCSGIYIKQKFEAHVTGPNPDITVSMRLNPYVSGGKIKTTITKFDVDVDYPLWFEILTLGVAEIVEYYIEDKLRSKLREKIKKIIEEKISKFTNVIKVKQILLLCKKMEVYF